MIYETYEEILENMLNKVPSDIDKREGSINFNSLAPSAAELAQAYVKLSLFKDETYADTAIGEDLTRRASEKGIIRKDGINAVRKGLFNIDVPIGSRFNGDNLNYVVLEKITTGEFKLECETVGEIGNIYSGQLIPVDYIDGLETANLSDIIIPGEDEEDDDSLRQRYFEEIKTPSTSGNKKNYESWAKEVSGIGYAKSYPRWNGVNTVKVVVLSSNKTAISDAKVQEVKDYIEENRPLGADVTVISALEKSIDISVKLTLVDGSNIDSIRSAIQKNIEAYFYDIAFSSNIVRYTKIGESILNNDFVTDYENLLINNSTGNIELSNIEIPVLGALTII